MNVSVSQVSLVARLAQDLTFRDVPASQARQFGVGVCKDILVALFVGLSGWQVSRLDLSACLLSHSLSNLRELRQLRPLGTFDQTHTADFPVCASLALLGAHTLKVFNKSSRGAIVYNLQSWADRLANWRKALQKSLGNPVGWALERMNSTKEEKERSRVSSSCWGLPHARWQSVSNSMYQTGAMVGTRSETS